jgi:hypothetical protein
MIKKTTCFFFVLLLAVSTAQAQRQRFVEFTSYRVNLDVSKVKLSDDVWQKSKPYRQPLQRQFLEVPKPAEVGVKEALVQSVNDGRYIAFRLAWKDATKDDSIKIMNFSDGAAIQFPVRKEAFPEFFMGEKDKPVHILYWRAWRSKDKKDGFQTTKTAYPNMTSDIYNFDYSIKGIGTEKTQAEKDIFIAGRAAKNPLSFPRKELIAELSSVGSGTLASMNVENTSGHANWENGEWTVIFRRPLTVNDPESVQFKTGEKMPIAFAIWEGSRREAGGRKAVSPAWAEVEVEK